VAGVTNAAGFFPVNGRMLDFGLDRGADFRVAFQAEIRHWSFQKMQVGGTMRVMAGQAVPFGHREVNYTLLLQFVALGTETGAKG